MTTRQKIKKAISALKPVQGISYCCKDALRDLERLLLDYPPVKATQKEYPDQSDADNYLASIHDSY